MSNEPAGGPPTGPTGPGAEPRRLTREDFSRVGRHAAPADAPTAPANRTPAAPSRRARHRRAAPRSRLRTGLIGLAGVLVVAVGLLIGVATFTTKTFDAGVSRVGNALPEGARPAGSAGGALTFLLAGVEPVPDAERPLLDAVTLVHVTAGAAHAQLVHLPVGTWTGGTTLGGAFTDGGAAGLTGAVETLTGVRVDHFAQLDFAGFSTVVDDLGGVDVDVPEPYRNRGHDFPAGRQHLDGAAALAYVRDADEAARATTAVRQQAVVVAVFDKASRLGVLSDLGTLQRTLGSLASAVQVDDTLSDTGLVDLAWQLRGVGRPDFLTAPVAGAGTEAGTPVQYLDAARASALWGYLRADTLAAHLAEFR